MGRSYAMQDIINTITSTGHTKILREYNDFLITHSFIPDRVDYEIWSFIDNPDGKKLWRIKSIPEADIVECLRNPEKKQYLMNGLRYGGTTIPYNEETIKKNLSKDNLVVLAEGKNFIAVKELVKGWEAYEIESPMFGKSAMEDSYPWSTEITKEQAKQFMYDYQLASAYYQKVRYGK